MLGTAVPHFGYPWPMRYRRAQRTGAVAPYYQPRDPCDRILSCSPWIILVPAVAMHRLAVYPSCGAPLRDLPTRHVVAVCLGSLSLSQARRMALQMLRKISITYIVVEVLELQDVGLAVQEGGKSSSGLYKLDWLCGWIRVDSVGFLAPVEDIPDHRPQFFLTCSLSLCTPCCTDIRNTVT